MKRPAAGASILALITAVALGGCANPDAPERTASRHVASPRSPGEPDAPGPPSAATQGPAQVQRTPTAALAAFASRYVNWSYRTLAGQQRALVAISVGSARLAEEQALASSGGDSTITAGQIRNSGTVVGISTDLTDAGRWLVVTREQTHGGAQYQGLPRAYHVTLARLAAVGGGYAVSEWLPQS
jgi:hypothetical protein